MTQQWIMLTKHFLEFEKREIEKKKKNNNNEEKAKGITLAPQRRNLKKETCGIKLVFIYIQIERERDLNKNEF